MIKQKAIKLLITDFDGTLVDSFEANLKAYQTVFEQFGLELSEDKYRTCFGLRFDEFMDKMDITDIKTRIDIKKNKSTIYPDYFSFLKVNKPLLNFIYSFKLMGGATAIASTARRENLMNVLTYINAVDTFDLILAGEDVENGKPNPEIYKKILQYFKIDSSMAIVFEDTVIGMEAAANAGINYIQINTKFYGN